MRALLAISVLSIVGCGGRQAAPRSEPAAPPTEAAKPESASPAGNVAAPAMAKTPLSADTPSTTVAGNTFIAPAGWSISVRGPATILEPPEPGSFIALVDVKAKDADAALAAGWAAVRPDAKRTLKVTNQAPDKDGWTDNHVYTYETSPNERRDVRAAAQRGGETWTVVIYDVADAVGEKRGAQIQLIFGRLLPKGRQRESFAGKTAHTLDAARIAELGKFVERSQQALGVPGVSIGLVQNGTVVFAGGFGVRELGKPDKVDADTRYIIASNTKALTTLMLAKLVDGKQLTWDTPATQLLPSFKLGDADTTSRVRVKHLICACTGMPRQDLEILFEFKKLTPAGVMTALGTMQPTSKFGELFQYSNVLAAAAGFIGGHVAFPKLELGAAYDRAMQTLVFGPLGMTSTTFDYARARRGNYARPHGFGVDGKPQPAQDALTFSAIPVRPAGAAWSTVNDVLKYVQLELAEGKLPDGKTYISKDALLARHAPQVALNKDATYGMGLVVDKTYGIPVVRHGGDLPGYHSDMIWLPEHGVGAVILTNGDLGIYLRGLFRRKLLEVLFDGKPEAEAGVAAQAKAFFEQAAADRQQLTVPADPAEAGKLAARYKNAALGEIVVTRKGNVTTFDFGEWKSEVGSRKDADGSTSFVTLAPGIDGFGITVGSGAKRTLVIRDAQHEYVFDEQ